MKNTFDEATLSIRNVDQENDFLRRQVIKSWEDLNARIAKANKAGVKVQIGTAILEKDSVVLFFE